MFRPRKLTHVKMQQPFMGNSPISLQIQNHCDIKICHHILNNNVLFLGLERCKDTS